MLYGSSQGWYLPSESANFHIDFPLPSVQEEKGLYKIERISARITPFGSMEVAVYFKRKFAGVFLRTAFPQMLLSVIVFSSNLYFREMFDAAITVNVTRDGNF